LFKVLLWIYFKWLWAIVHRGTFVGGHWRYYYNDNYDGQAQDFAGNDGTGDARIEHTPEGITIHAETLTRPGHPEEAPIRGLAHWNTTSSIVTGERIDITLTLDGTRGAGEGIGRIHIITKKTEWGFPRLPEELSGKYYIIAQDPSRTVRWGRIVFRRSSG
jgi:hypothetical protein